MNSIEPDQIEVSIFGPGYGECILIHIGSGQWIIVDSCVNSSGHCVALEYLRDLGFSTDAVRLIVATHWHDDHVRGLSALLNACPGAAFVVSLAMSTKQFAAMALARKSMSATLTSSGVSEISRVYSLLSASGQIAIKAKAHSTIFAASAADLAHGFDCKVTALSPSERQLDIFLDDIAQLVPLITESENRCISRSPNNFAVVALVQIGSTAILLGADLEETTDANTGWTFIVESDLRPKEKAIIFKIPHHGSQNAHNQDVWSEMLSEQPIAILTPWGRGTGLPKDSDVARISALTRRAYSTSRLGKRKSRTRYAPAVERTLKEARVIVRNAEPALGHICLRNGGLQDFEQWTVTLSQGACSLNEWGAAA